MKFEVKKEWLDTIKEQEKSLVFNSFDNDTAAQIGFNIVELAKTKYKKAVAISVEIDNNVVFSYMMQGTAMENKLWIVRKANVSKLTKESSLKACVEAVQSGIPKELERGDSFALCGGCWPVKTQDSEPYAYISVSGLEHYLDHQIIVDAMSVFLKRSTKTIFI